MIASLIVALYLMGIISIQSATASLYIAGALLIIAEFGVISFGLIAFNGVLALYAGYALQTGNDIVFSVPLNWPILFGIAFIELFIIATTIFVHMWTHNKKMIIGKEAMIGEKVTIIKWNEHTGTVNFEGEIWQAKSEHALDIKPNEDVTIKAINKLKLTITV